MAVHPILIVEDDEPTQTLLRAILQRFGHASDIAGNGKEAIDLLRERQYAAVILDLMMPDVSGKEVLDFLKAESIRVPVVICTAAGVSSTTAFDPDLVKAVVRKPFDVDELGIVIEGLTAPQIVSGL